MLYACSRQHFELATSITNSAELKSLHETNVEIAPEHNEPTFSSAFRSTEETKVIGVDFLRVNHDVFAGSPLTCQASRWWSPNTNYALI